MSISKKILLISLLFLLFACASRTAMIRKDMENLKPGMSKQEIISKWGNPDNTGVKFFENTKFEIMEYIIGKKEVATMGTYKPQSAPPPPSGNAWGAFASGFASGFSSWSTSKVYQPVKLLLYFKDDKLIGWETITP